MRRHQTERKSILITGASSGLGEGMARQFAAKGRNLALCARRTDRLDALRSELLTRYPQITVSTRELDVNDHAAVFTVFESFADEFGHLDRVVVNAGMGKGASLGTGSFEANRQTAQTNFVGALAQAEAALEHFRARQDGHLVLISSMSAVRGMPRSLTTYAASKTAIFALGEGIRADLLDSPITVSTILPGYIRSEINAKVKNTPLMVDTEKGCRLLVAAIEREPHTAIVPAWPWRAVNIALRVLPLRAVATRFA